VDDGEPVERVHLGQRPNLEHFLRAFKQRERVAKTTWSGRKYESQTYFPRDYPLSARCPNSGLALI